MKSRLEFLLEKYWVAESTLEEEKELKALLLQVEGFEKEKALFGLLEDFKKVEPKSVQIPESKPIRTIKPENPPQPQPASCRGAARKCALFLKSLTYQEVTLRHLRVHVRFFSIRA